MAEFPTLKTGAPAQYPLRRGLRFGTRILHFVDGGEQRIAQRRFPERTWRIQLNKVDQAELLRLEESFIASSSGSQSICFTDPLDGREFVGCHFAGGTLDLAVTPAEWGIADITLVSEGE